jgi:hypothetical protein
MMVLPLRLSRLLSRRRGLTTTASSSVGEFRERLREFRREALETVERRKREQQARAEAQRLVADEQRQCRDREKLRRRQEVDEKSRVRDAAQQVRLDAKREEKARRARDLDAVHRRHYLSMVHLLEQEAAAFVGRDTLDDRIHHALTHPTQFQVPLEVLKHTHRVKT